MSCESNGEHTRGIEDNDLPLMRYEPSMNTVVVVVHCGSAAALPLRARGLAWSILRALGARDPGSNPGEPISYRSPR